MACMSTISREKIRILLQCGNATGFYLELFRYAWLDDGSLSTENGSSMQFHEIKLKSMLHNMILIALRLNIEKDT